MGFGDGKLALSIGLLLGAPNGFSAIILAFILGSVCALAFTLFGSLFNAEKRLTMKSEIPFAPFLILGAWLALIYNLDLLYVSSLIA